MAEPFAVHILARRYEFDSTGHLNNASYHQYGDQARWELLRAAGISVDDVLASGVRPVTLEATIRFHSDLRYGQEIAVSCAFVWGQGRTFQVDHEFHRDNGSLLADLTSTDGLMNIADRHLIADPGAHWRALSSTPRLLGL